MFGDNSNSEIININIHSIKRRRRIHWQKITLTWNIIVNPTKR